ncbi:DUF1876 domain-containing protein [Streptomyces sp. NPDC005438]|uniref:DUF1876 domain-containing protein n=1 Tax=Streptomyces sp. NPDC005438 TaxID=3156880 RepID=UPI0033A17D15
MTRELEWNVRLYLREEGTRTTARVVLQTADGALTGHGVARRNPEDTEVPAIGEELSAGRALDDLARQLLINADRDVAALDRPRDGALPVDPMAGHLD